MKIHDLFENDDWEDDDYHVPVFAKIQGLDHQLGVLIEQFKNLMRQKVLVREEDDTPFVTWKRFIVPRGIVNTDSVVFYYHVSPDEKGRKKMQYLQNLHTKIVDTFNLWKMYSHGVDPE